MTLFLRQHKRESLHLFDIHLNSELSCRAVATAEVQDLELEYDDLEDGGAALVESIS
jgi:hypothetical protein